MLRHIGMLTLVEIADREHVAAGLRELVGVIPGLLAADVMLDAGLAPGNASLVFVMTFEDEDAWRGYGSHPAHKALVGERIAPVLAAKGAVQVRWE